MKYAIFAISLLITLNVLGQEKNLPLPKGFDLAQEGENFKLYKNDGKKLKKLSINGEKLTDFPYSLIIEGVHPKEGLIVITDINKKIGLANLGGKVLIPCKNFAIPYPDTISEIIWVKESYPSIDWVYEGNLPKMGWKMYDFNGQLITPVEFDIPFKMKNGTGVFYKDKKYGLWRNNSVSVKPQFDESSYFNNALFAFRIPNQLHFYDLNGNLFGKYYAEQALNTGNDNIIAIKDGGIWGLYTKGTEFPYMMLKTGRPDHDIAAELPKWSVTGWIQSFIKADSKNLPFNHKNLLFNHLAQDFLNERYDQFDTFGDLLNTVSMPFYFANDYEVNRGIETSDFYKLPEYPSEAPVIEIGHTPMVLSFVRRYTYRLPNDPVLYVKTETTLYTTIKSIALSGVGYVYDGPWSNNKLSFILDIEKTKLATFTSLFLKKAKIAGVTNFNLTKPEDIWETLQHDFIVQPEGIKFFIGRHQRPEGSKPIPVLLTWKELKPFEAKKDAYQYNVFME